MLTNFTTPTKQYSLIELNKIPVEGKQTILLEKANTIKSDLMNLEKYTREQVVTLPNEKQVPAISNYKVALRYFRIYQQTKAVIEATRKLKDSYNEDRQRVLLARREYDLASDRASEKLKKTNKDECKMYANKDELRRIRRYLVNFVTIKLLNAINTYESSSGLELDSEATYNALKDSLVLVNTNIIHANTRLDNICKEQACDANDFIPNTTAGYFNTALGEKTIKCRIKYKLFNSTMTLRLEPEKLDLKNYHTKTNTARELAKTATTIEKDYQSTGGISGRTFSYAKVTGAKNYELYGLSTNSPVKLVPSNIQFANRINTKNRVYEQITSFENGDDFHAEVRTMEHIANNDNCKLNSDQKTFNCDEIYVELFADRETCSSCEQFIRKVKDITPKIHITEYYGFSVPTVTLQGIFYSGEKIPTKDLNFYLGIN